MRLDQRRGLFYPSGITRVLDRQPSFDAVDFFPRHRCLAICQYNRERFSPEVILDVIRTHPLVIHGSTVSRNFYYVPPDEFLRPNRPSAEVSRMLAAIGDRERAENDLRDLRDRLQDLVRERTAELELVNKELEAFSYSVSHDLRAPLRAMDGFGAALLEDCGERLDERGRDYLARIRGASRRMGQLIEDLLRLSRISRAEMRRERVDLGDLARTVLDDLRSGATGRSVRTVVAPDLIARGDPDLLRILMENLLSNAWKFTARNEDATIEFGTEILDGERVFLVRDDGAGFDMKYASQLFAPFQRLHAAGEFPGTGIGLATVQRIVHRHGGRIWAEAASGRGVTFRFTLGEGGKDR